MICGKDLIGRQKKTCSIECHREWTNKYYRERYQKISTDKFCVICGKLLMGRQQKTCSDECRRDWRKEYQQKYDHKYYQNNQKNIKKYRQNNQERMKRYQQKYRLKYYWDNKEKAKMRSRKHYLNNQEELKRCYRRSRSLPEDWDLSRESSIEFIMRRWLQESDIEFVQQYSINFKDATNTKVDFYIPEANACLYCDGDYWHGPKRLDVQKRDVKINKALERMGHNVVRMTETEILEGNRPWWIGELMSAKW